MDGTTSVQQEYSRVLADLIVYYLAVSNTNEPGARQRYGAAHWEDLSDDKLLLIVGNVSHDAQRRTPDRLRIMKMATIRYLAGPTNAADYGDRLFNLSDEVLQGVLDRLSSNRSKAADLRPAMRDADLPSSADYDDRPVKAGATAQVSFLGYKAWRFSEKGREAFRQGEVETEAAIVGGKKHWSVKALFEELRSKGRLGAFEDGGWNNNYTAAFGRDMKATHPEWQWPKDFFEPRASVSDAWPRITGQMVNSIPASF